MQVFLKLEVNLKNNRFHKNFIAANDLWEKYPPFKENGLYRSNVLNHNFSQSSPEYFWYYFGQEYNLYQ